VSTAEVNEFAEVMDRVRGWSPGLRIALAKGILDSLQSAGAPAPPRGRSVEGMIGMGRPDAAEAPTRGVPVESVLGILKTDREPPDDEECRRIVEEERWKKYGA
jgi:hypothetical protein